MNAEEYDGSLINDYTRYQVGFSETRYDPQQEKHRHMLYLVAYDIRTPRRLRRVAKVCEDYGIRVEYSVFECDLTQENFERMWQEITKEIDIDEDSVLAYRICGACVERIESIGDVVRPEKVLLYMP